MKCLSEINEAHDILIKIFNEFIDVINEQPVYTIGLIGLDDIIIKSSKEMYVGKNKNIIKRNEYNTIQDIIINNEKLGELWVKGDSNIVWISNLILDSLVTRLLYELYEQSLIQNITKDHELIKLLLDSKNFDSEKVMELSRELNVNMDLARAAILIVNEKGFESKEIPRLKLKEDSKQIIYALLNKNNLLIFKDVPIKYPNYEVKEYLNNYIQNLKSWGISNSSFIIGSIQNKLIDYKYSYYECKWLKENKTIETDKIYYYSDFLLGTFMDKINYDCIFNHYKFYVIDNKNLDVEEFIYIARNYFVNNYNITKTAESMFMHKNTLIYKIKGYEELLGLDIRGKAEDKLIFMLIAASLKQYQLRKQVGELE